MPAPATPEPSGRKSADLSRYLGPGFAIGIALGAGIGAAMQNVTLGVGIGVALGPAIALGMAARASRKHDSTPRL